jgi:Sec-independent protein translocase protein TatA
MESIMGVIAWIVLGAVVLLLFGAVRGRGRRSRRA